VVTGVTASQALLDEAVRLEADAVIVHHGYFWKGESPIIRGMKRKRLKTLLANDINLYGWHLPLDAHPELGNNVQLASLLGINVMGEIAPLVPWGELSMAVSGLELASWIEARLGRKPLWCGDTGPDKVAAWPGAPAVGRALSTARPALASMRLLPVKFQSKPSTRRASRGCISTPPGTMPPSAAASAR
jgi:dinuclear metal center YbgI/SA1388 family protein